MGKHSSLLMVRCPRCRTSMPLTEDLTQCPECGRRMKGREGVLNFVSSAARDNEREYYDKAYQSKPTGRTDAKQEIGGFEPYWYTPTQPENEMLLASMGNLTGKTILLLGNGASSKELRFILDSPSHLVYSDLSVHALEKIQGRFNIAPYKEKITFAGIDAHDIPFEDDSFDIVYGFAMVHHLPDLSLFFDSVMRVLKPGGMAVFRDNAFSPIWHGAKKTILYPVMIYSHRKNGISPEDFRFSMGGGFREASLAAKIEKAGGLPWFTRVSFINYLLYRAAGKLLPKTWQRWICRPEVFKRVNRLDRAVGQWSLVKKNQIRLIWGFTKPD